MMARTLPRNIHLKDGRYYYVKTKAQKTTWTPLTRDLSSSISIANNIIGADTERDFVALRRRLRISWCAARWRSLKYKLPFELEWQQVLDMAETQRWHCALTGRPFTLDAKNRRAAGPFGPSIDRIRSAEGYTAGNVRLICVAINYALNEWGEDFFAELATAFLRLNTPKSFEARFERLAITRANN